jgi:type I restriction enzyme S subunit
MIRYRHQTILGDIPNDWDARPLRSLLLDDLSGDWGDEEGEVSLSVLRSTNFTDSGNLNLDDVAQRGFTRSKAEQVQVQANDILVERSGGGPNQPVGRVVMIREELPATGFANFVQTLRPNTAKISAELLLWTLHQLNRSGFVERLQHQTTQMRNLDLRDYLKVLVPVAPDPNEQTRIAETLKAADDVIRRLEGQIRKAERVKKALMQRAFPYESDTTGLPTINRLIVAPVTNGYSPVCPDYETGRWMLGLDALTAHGFDPEGRKPAPSDDPNLLGNELHENDILISRSNTRQRVGYAGLYQGYPAPCFYPDLMMRVRVDHGKVRPGYLDLLLQSEFARRFFQSRAGGTSGSMVKIKERDVRQMPVILPCVDEQDIVVERIKSGAQLIAALKAQLTASRRLQQSLLQNLLTGKVRLKA